MRHLSLKAVFPCLAATVALGLPLGAQEPNPAPDGAVSPTPAAEAPTPAEAAAAANPPAPAPATGTPAATGTNPAPAGAVRNPPPAKIQVTALPATIVDDVVVPVPSEVFGALDKLGEPEWRALVRESASSSTTQRHEISLLLGTTIANGFIAVQAQDQEAVKRVGQEVLTLANVIAVREYVLPHCSAIIDSADKSDWPRVRVELDRAQQNVRQAMIELKDEQLAQLVSLGGWLRGTEAVTSIVERDYSPAAAELLHQPDLLRYFQQRLANMDDRLRDNSLVPRIEEELTAIAPLLEQEGTSMPLESVKRIHDVTVELVAAIEKREGA